MLLYYHKDPDGNFGDDLNPWLWSRLLPGQFTGAVAHDPRRRGAISSGETLFVGIGTLLNAHVPERPRKVVFGSGAGYGGLPVIDATWDIRCVRGPVTARMLGLHASAAVTDPAVLVRTLDLGAAPPASEVSYMPHCSSARAADWDDIAASSGLTFIDPQWPVERVLHAICASRLLITEALHGAIVADALRVPWVPVASSAAVLDVKWHDFCQSVGLEYRPARVPVVWAAGSTASVWARARSRTKSMLAGRALRRVARSAKPIMSSSAAMDRVTDTLQERLATFRQRYASVVPPFGAPNL